MDGFFISALFFDSGALVGVQPSVTGKRVYHKETKSCTRQEMARCETKVKLTTQMRSTRR